MKKPVKRCELCAHFGEPDKHGFADCGRITDADDYEDTSTAYAWDYEGYPSAGIVWTANERVTSGGASSYRDPAGTAMTIYRGWEFGDAPYGAGSGIVTQLLSTVNRPVRTVEVTSDEFAVTGTVKCGGSVWLYDPDNGLVDRTQQLVWAGRVITPISARVVAATWPVPCAPCRGRDRSPRRWR